VQTVIPKRGHTVVVVKGPYLRQKATLLERSKSKGTLTVQTAEELAIVEVGEDDAS
jgi:hypothetical protein